MKTTHSWKWLVPRFISHRPRSAAAGQEAIRRPCLALEGLEDRSLLSAAGTDIVIVPPTGDAAILIGLMKGTLAVTQDEFNLLEALGNSVPAESKVESKGFEFTHVIDKASPLLFQLEDELAKISESLIKGNLTEKKAAATDSKLQYLQIKLTDVIISSVNAESKKTITPILDSLFADANGLVDGLLSVQGAGAADQKQMIDFVNLSADIMKIDHLALGGEMALARKAGKGQQDFFSLDFQAKIERAFQKANEAIVDLGEPSTSVLLPAVQEFEDGIMNLLGSLDGGGDFDGGIILPPTDDIIT